MRCPRPTSVVLGVLVISAPEVYPVNFVVDDHTIVFRAGSSAKLLGIERSPSLFFEADGIDVDQQTGWSVLVKDRATVLVTADDLHRVISLPLRPGLFGVKDHWLRIRPDQVTGRRIQTF